MLRHNSLQLSNNLNGTNSCNGGSALDALPKQFVVSMKTLFDILDDQLTGLVKFSDIEKGWQDDGCKGLPIGVIESLRKVTPSSGLLSFERFCAGLKLCLLRNQSDMAKTNVAASVITGPAYVSLKSKSPIKPPRPPSAPLLEIENPLPIAAWSVNPTSSVHPHNIVGTQRAWSMPQLSPDSEMESELANARISAYNSPPPPPKPPRASAIAGANVGSISTTAGNATTGPLDKAEIRHALQNWQMGVLLNEMDGKDKRNSTYLPSQFQYRGCADGGSSSATDSVNGTVALHAKKSSGKRREPRRHTLQSGIDYNMLKRLKQFEEEREVLLFGLEAVEKARDWYLQQVANVQEKIKYLGRMGTHVEQWSEVQQERLNFQRARVLEVNRSLAVLADTWERGGFPLHFNLAIRSVAAGLQPAERLRQQNRHLTDEVNLKGERIALLEREKQTLLRELFDLQQRMGLSSRGTGFISVLSQSSPVCSSSSGGLGDADVVY